MDPWGPPWARQRARVKTHLDRTIDLTGPGLAPSRAAAQAAEQLQHILWMPLEPSVATRVTALPIPIGSGPLVCPEWLSAMTTTFTYALWIGSSFSTFGVQYRPTLVGGPGYLELPPDDMSEAQAVRQFREGLRQLRAQRSGRRRPQHGGETTVEHATWAYARIVHRRTWDSIAEQTGRTRKAISKGVDSVLPLLIGFTRLDPI